MHKTYTQIMTAISGLVARRWPILTNRDDRGAIPSEVAWAGAMVLMAVTTAGLLSGRVQDYIGNIDFGP